MVCQLKLIRNTLVTSLIITDINECELYTFCDQGCVNLDGSYECTCKKGYYWSGGFGIGCFGKPQH